jgi:hypothetical protein
VDVDQIDLAPEIFEQRSHDQLVVAPDEPVRKSSCMVVDSSPIVVWPDARARSSLTGALPMSCRCIADILPINYRLWRGGTDSLPPAIHLPPSL